MDADHMKQSLRSHPITRFFGLRLKFVLLFSVILIVTCSSLSWYFVETRRRAMTDTLQELGTILLTNTVQNDHFRIGGIVLEDRETLEQFMHSLMTIDHVVYLVITASDGRILDQQSKRTRRRPVGSSDATQQPIYPDDRIPESLRRTPLTAPIITRFVLSSKQELIPQDESSDWLLPFWFGRKLCSTSRCRSSEIWLTRLTYRTGLKKGEIRHPQRQTHRWSVWSASGLPMRRLKRPC